MYIRKIASVAYASSTIPNEYKRRAVAAQTARSFAR